jgi:PAS domain S-box-containing protein
LSPQETLVDPAAEVGSDAAGSARSTGALAAEVAALKQEVAALRARESRLSAVFDNTLQFIGVLSLDGAVVEANRSALALIGAERGSVVGRHFADTPWWAHSTALQARLREAIEAAKGGTSEHFEATHPALDGSLHTIDFSVKPLFGQDGTFTQLLCEGRDISDRARAERSLRESRAMLGLVFDAIPERVFWKDRDCRYLGCNRAFALDAGVETVEQVIGRTDFDFAWRAQAELYRGDDLRVMETGLAVVNYEEPQTSPQGRDLWLRTSKTPLRNQQGEVVGILGVYEDITARKTEEQQRLALERRMQQAQKLESLGLLAGTIAHDFNNLLFAIVGNLEVLAARTEAEQESLEAIATASKRAGDLCRQLLAYSGRGQNVVAPLDLNEVVREMTSLLRMSVKKQATLTLSLDEALPVVNADATQLRQVLLNLITNASDALGDREGEIRVTTSRRRVPADTAGGLAPGDYIELAVSDTGCGMDEATRARIFEPFFTTKDTGRGLGLAAVRGIIEGHRGLLEVESAPSKGTRFRIHLPALLAPPPAAAAQWRGSGKALLVDHEAADLEAQRQLAESLGFEVETALDGREALDKFAAGKFAFVSLTLSLPRLDGLEVTRALRARDPGVKVLLTSTYDLRGSLVELDRSRPDAFLPKPVSSEGLIEALRGLHGADARPLVERPAA